MRLGVLFDDGRFLHGGYESNFYPADTAWVVPSTPEPSISPLRRKEE